MKMMTLETTVCKRCHDESVDFDGEMDDKRRMTGMAWSLPFCGAWGITMFLTTVMSSTGAVLGGAAIALVWMAWASVQGQRQSNEVVRTRPQRAPKIVRQ